MPQAERHTGVDNPRSQSRGGIERNQPVINIRGRRMDRLLAKTRKTGSALLTTTGVTKIEFTFADPVCRPFKKRASVRNQAS